MLRMDNASHKELLTPTQAARLKGVSRQWIANLIRQGKLDVVKIAGRNFVRQSEVLNYKAAPKTGRPPNTPATADKRATGRIHAGNKASATKKRGGRK